MTATKFINLISLFELHSVGHRTLDSAMLYSFGFDWELVPEYRQVADYVNTFMTYDAETGHWY